MTTNYYLRKKGHGGSQEEKSSGLLENHRFGITLAMLLNFLRDDESVPVHSPVLSTSVKGNTIHVV